MSPPNDSSNNASAVRLLKIAALVFAGFGGSLSAWGVDKWINQPQARASQFGFEAPLWPAFTLFVLLATVVIVGLFWTAAERVADGEDLFAQRHRRRSSSEESSNGRPQSE